MSSAGTAWAHECYNASRSEQGNAGASNSQAWLTVSVADFANSGEAFPAALADCFLSHWFAGGGPATFTIHVKGVTGTGGVIAENAPAATLADGRGIDHIEDAYGALLEASIGACLAG
jgi:hypothetical protein